MSVRRVALLTAGGFAPCLSSAVGGLIERYTEIAPDIEIIAYQHGYYGLLRGDKIVIDDETRAKAGILHQFGGSPIGNSRVKLTNAEGLRQARPGRRRARTRCRWRPSSSRPTASTCCTPSVATTRTRRPRTSPRTCTRTATT